MGTVCRDIEVAWFERDRGTPPVPAGGPASAWRRMPGRPALEGRVLVAAGITGAGLEAISGSGHRVEVEHPAEARPAVLSFPGGPP